MTIAASNLVADIATASPATIRVFQRHRIDFCCGGKVPLAEVCDRQQLDPATLVAELNAATATVEAPTDWTRASLTALVDHIQRRFHRPLAIELPRLSAMMAKVVSRHGDHLPETLLPLQATFETLAAPSSLRTSRRRMPSSSRPSSRSKPAGRRRAWGRGSTSRSR